MKVNNEALSFLNKSGFAKLSQNGQSAQAVRRMSAEDAARKPIVPGQDRVQIREGVFADMVKPGSGANTSQSVHQKLMAGKPLSDEDLAWLKENDPIQYQKALLIKAEREAYKKELERCRSKEEVQKLKQRKMEQFVAEANSIQSSSMSQDDKIKAMQFLEMRRAAIENEHKTFVETERYKLLPEKREKKDDAPPPAELDDPTTKALAAEMKEADKAVDDAAGTTATGVEHADAPAPEPTPVEAPAEPPAIVEEPELPTLSVLA